MKSLNIYLVLVFLMLFNYGCNRDEIFTREQYKHVVSLISNRTEGSFNIFEEEMDLTQNPCIGHIAVSSGGALPITEPIILNMAVDPQLLET